MVGELVVLFALLALGLGLGSASWRGVSLGPAAMLVVALLAGHMGLELPGVLRELGLVLFLYTVGLQAGPGFFEALRQEGIRPHLAVLAMIGVVLLGTWGFRMLFPDLDPRLWVGVFAGALTSTPGLAVAVEAMRSSVPIVGYTLSYPLGMLAAVVGIRLLPRWLGWDLEAARRAWEAEQRRRSPARIARNFRITNPNLDGRTFRELDLGRAFGVVISRHAQDDWVLPPHPDRVVRLGDRVRAIGTPEELERFALFVGQPIEEELPFSGGFTSAEVLVTHRAVVGRTLRELDLFRSYGVTVARIQRAGLDVPPTGNQTLEMGDKLVLVGPEVAIPDVVRLLGNDIRRLGETDWAPAALGIALGLWLGSLPLGPLRLGTAGGVLLAGLVLGRLGKTGPILWRMSTAGAGLLRQLGVSLFLAVVGVEAGSALEPALRSGGWRVALMGAGLTVAALLVGAYWLRRWAYNPLLALGVLCGGMTSGVALSSVSQMSDSEAPSMAYALVYPVALMLTIAGARLLAAL
ncbi:MAG: hypothetical protein NZ993_07920 [Bacteroidetes bacterium]|nr:hypothetical protein [Bacteroidota bacterium]